MNPFWRKEVLESRIVSNFLLFAICDHLPAPESDVQSLVSNKKTQQKTIFSPDAAGVKDALAETTVADREMAAEEERMTLYLHQNWQKHPKTARESVTERIRTKRKTLRNPVQVITDRTRVEEEIFPEFRKLFRNRLLSQNRKRRNQK